MFTEPKVDRRDEQPYMGIRMQVTMGEMPQVIPQSFEELFAWLGERGIAPVGLPFVRFHVIDMDALMDIEMGVPVESSEEGDDQVTAGKLPAGRYASLVYTGLDNAIAANGALLKWGDEQGLGWDKWPVEKGEAFGGRYETTLTDPDEEPDTSKWETEVAIRLANK
jgi:effector-binding domain-containing protein